MVSVIDDKKRGLVAQVAADGASETAIQTVLGDYVRPWDMASEAIAAE